MQAVVMMRVALPRRAPPPPPCTAPSSAPPNPIISATTVALSGGCERCWTHAGWPRSVRRSTALRVAASGDTTEPPSVPAVLRDAAPRVAPPPPPPAAVPVQHSSAYGRRPTPSTPTTAESKRTPSKVTSSNALQAALSSLDDQLDAMESVPNPVAKAAWTVGRVTTAASSDPRVQAAAKSATQAGAAAMKKALPLGAKVGQWAVKKAIGVAASMDEVEAEQRRPKKAAGKKDRGSNSK